MKSTECQSASRAGTDRGNAGGARHRWWALSVTGLAIFMVTTDWGLLSVSLPVILGEFNADLALGAWIAFIYALVTGALYLPCGRLSDLVGRRKTFSAGFLIYALSSLMAGASTGPNPLILFRALQAAGSALIMSNTFALVTSLFPAHERGRAMGLSGGLVAATGYTLGPALGGFLTHAMGWRSIFYVPALMGIVGFIAALYLLSSEEDPASGKEVGEPFDLTGTAAFALGLSLFLLALTTGQKGRWHELSVQAGFAGSMALLAFFLWWEKRNPYPLLDLRLFGIRAFAAGNVARLASFVSVSMNSLVMPFFLQLGLGLDPLKAGVLMTPTTLGLAVLSPVSGWLSDRIGSRIPSSAGLLIMAAAFVLLASVDLQASPLKIALILALLGMGFGLFQTPNNNALMGSIPRDRLGIGSSFLAIVRSVGQSVGTALATAILSARLVAVTGEASLQSLEGAAGEGGYSLLLSAFMQGFSLAYLTAGLICLAGVIASSVREQPGKEG